MFKSLSSLLHPFLIGTCLFGILTTAAPVANTTTTTDPVKRQAVQSCWWDDNVFYIDWSIHLNNDDQYDNGGCGRGFLDNFRGRCGDITDWSCVYDEGSDIFMDFKTSDFCTEQDITDAINAASYGNLNIPCTWILAGESSE